MATENVNGHYTQICFDVCLSLDPSIPTHSRCRGYCCTLKDTHSVGLLWTGARSVAETSTRQHTTLTRDGPPCPPKDSKLQSLRSAVWHFVISKFITVPIEQQLIELWNSFYITYTYICLFIFIYLFIYSLAQKRNSDLGCLLVEVSRLRVRAHARTHAHTRTHTNTQ